MKYDFLNLKFISHLYERTQNISKSHTIWRSCPVVFNNDIPPELVINLDQTSLSYVTPGKYTFSFKGAKNVPIKVVDDKGQITATFAVSSISHLLAHSSHL